MKWLGIFILHIGILLPSNASANKHEWQSGTCILLLVREAVPAQSEWTGWISTAASRVRDDQDGWEPSLGVGGELSLGIAQLSSGRHYGGAFILRGGPWAKASTSFDGALAEGGLHISFGQKSHASWGTFAARLGGGYGDELGNAIPHITATITAGVHSFLGRYSERGYCDRPAKRRSHGFGSVIRFFATWRSTFEEPRVQQWTFGIELTPNYFFPPYSALKWGGGRP